MTTGLPNIVGTNCEIGLGKKYPCIQVRKLKIKKSFPEMIAELLLKYTKAYKRDKIITIVYSIAISMTAC